MLENIAYLVQTYDQSGFDAVFWLNFQGRFWSSTLLHGVTMAVFGLFYAGTYLTKTIHREDHQSPLGAFFYPPTIKGLWSILTLHATRTHFLFDNNGKVEKHLARTIILEGFWLAMLIHMAFNGAIEATRPEISFLIALFFYALLRRKV